MKSDASLSFNDALQKVYSKFPISGFSNTVRQSESAMGKYWRRVIFSEFMRYGGLPFVSILALLTFINFQLIFIFGTPMLHVLLFAVLITGYASLRAMQSIVKSEKGNVDDKYLVVSIFKSWAMVFSIFPFISSQFISDSKWVHYIDSEMTIPIVFFSIMYNLSFIWSVMVYYRFPDLIKNELNTKYAHLNLSV